MEALYLPVESAGRPPARRSGPGLRLRGVDHRRFRCGKRSSPPLPARHGRPPTGSCSSSSTTTSSPSARGRIVILDANHWPIGPADLHVAVCPPARGGRAGGDGDHAPDRRIVVWCRPGSLGAVLLLLAATRPQSIVTAATARPPPPAIDSRRVHAPSSWCSRPACDGDLLMAGNANVVSDRPAEQPLSPTSTTTRSFLCVDRPRGDAACADNSSSAGIDLPARARVVHARLYVETSLPDRRRPDESPPRRPRTVGRLQ